MRLSDADPTDRAAYIEGKAAVVSELTERALREWATQPGSRDSNCKAAGGHARWRAAFAART